MRFLKKIAHSQFNIEVYQWNNKFIIRLEAGMFEQTYKIDEYEVTSPEDLESCLDPLFLAGISSRFESMYKDFTESLQRNDIIF